MFFFDFVLNKVFLGTVFIFVPDFQYIELITSYWKILFYKQSFWITNSF